MNLIVTGLWTGMLFLLVCSCKKENAPTPEAPELQIQYARLGAESILNERTVVPEGNIVIGFSNPVKDGNADDFRLKKEENTIEILPSWSPDRMEVTLTPDESWEEGAEYTLIISDKLQSEGGGAFPGDTLIFSIQIEQLQLTLYRKDGTVLQPGSQNREISLLPDFQLVFSHPVPAEILKENMAVTGPDSPEMKIENMSDTVFQVSATEPWQYYRSYDISFKEEIGESISRPFSAVSYDLFTKLDSTYKFPAIADEDLLTLIQRQTFKYFWEEAHPHSGMGKERLSSEHTVTTGGSGFGLMAMIVAVERGFITRAEALQRWQQIFDFLATADRFHGAWSHWINGETGKVIPFSKKDNGADLVETAFLVQGMITVRQYLDPGNPAEMELIDQINTLWHEVEWDWFRRGGENVLYWHWSPEYEWENNLQIRGHDETQIVYVLAASSPGHDIDRMVYEEGYARSGGMKNGHEYYGYTLPLGPELGGPLFFAHYSYLGLDPRNLKDQYADYWLQNTNHSLINRAYCIDNPKNYPGYSGQCWGLTASDEPGGYSAHSPTNDPGVITPTAAISSLPYTPEESMQAIRHFYYLLGDRLWGDYGFYDAFSIGDEWVADSYLAIDQGPIICMIENHRSGLLWDLFMSAPEIQTGLNKLNFEYE